MNTTAPSTAADDMQRERREGSLLWGRTRALLDELEMLRAAVSPKKQAAAELAWRARSAAVRTLITTAVNNIRAQLEAMQPCHRAARVQAHLKAKRNTLYEYDRVPDLRTIRSVLTDMRLK